MRVRRTPTPFGRAVRVRLAQLNLQQRDLARMLGTSEAYITYLIYGDRREEAWVYRICAALDMPVPQATDRARDQWLFSPGCDTMQKTNIRKGE